MSMARVLLTALLSAWCFAAEANQDVESDKRPPAKQPESVDFRELRKLMPPELMGLKRRNLEGEMAANEWTARSSVTAEYVPEPPKEANAAKADVDAHAPRIEVQYMDHGTSPGVADVAGWAKSDVNSDDGNVSRRARKIAGFPAVETYDRGSRSGTLQVFVARRMVVLALTHDLPIEEFRKVGDALPVAKLAELVKP